jgi:Tol biopolymer transport system component
LVAGDDNNLQDVFVWDRSSSSLARVPGADGDFAAGPRISSDGRFIAFSSNTGIFTWDRTSSNVTRVAGGDFGSWAVDMSGDGGTVVFTSREADLVPGDVCGAQDVFVWSRANRSTTRISSSSQDSWDPTVSADGTLVAFVSDFPNLVVQGSGDLFLRRQDP